MARYFTWKLELVSNILQLIVDLTHFLDTPKNIFWKIVPQVVIRNDLIWALCQDLFMSQTVLLNLLKWEFENGAEKYLCFCLAQLKITVIQILASTRKLAKKFEN